jgi:hypothetical protein
MIRVAQQPFPPLRAAVYPPGWVPECLHALIPSPRPLPRFDFSTFPPQLSPRPPRKLRSVVPQPQNAENVFRLFAGENTDFRLFSAPLSFFPPLLAAQPVATPLPAPKFDAALPKFLPQPRLIKSTVRFRCGPTHP